jgi:hypothetical protein
MTRTAFDRDNVLTPEDRLVSARKCVRLLEPHAQDMSPGETSFLSSITLEVRKIQGIISERQLAWLRDLVTKYAT